MTRKGGSGNATLGLYDPAFLDIIKGQRQDPRENTRTHTCDIRCIRATYKKCVCRCGGANHGWLSRVQKDPQTELLLNHVEEVFKLFEDAVCPDCGYPLKYATIKGYRHSGGLLIPRYRERLWVYAECFRCGSQISFRRVVGRDTTLI